MTYGSLAADQISTSVTGVSLGPGNATNFKNRIINGGMVIDQRNAGASVTNIAGDVYSVDRWKLSCSAASKLTAQQNAGSLTPVATTGFVNYLGCTSSSAYSVGSSDYFILQQAIEGLNVADLAWGTASAKSVTLSFWVYSSLTGTFGGAIRNSASSYNYPFTYSISTANTWTQISITVAGPTSGTWLTTNGIGISVGFNLGTGSTYSGTAGSWTSSTVFSATGATSVVGTNGATFYITGVQLEVGSSASAFEYVDYTTQLAMCQRYYSNGYGGVSGFTFTSTEGIVCFSYPVQMRTTPTLGYSSGTSTSIDYIGGSQSNINLTTSGGGQNSKFFSAYITGMSGRTNWQGIIMNGNNISFTAEL